MAQNKIVIDPTYQDALPKDIKTEYSVLGTLIRRNELFAHVDDILLPDAFADESNAVIFRSIRWIIRSGKIADINSIVEAARSHKSVVKVEVDDNMVFNVASYFSESTFYQDVERLVNFSRRRKAWIGLQLMSRKMIDLTEDVDASLGELQADIDHIKGMGAVDTSILDAKAAIGKLNNVVMENQTGESTTTIKTGYRCIDNKGGFRLKELIVVASFSGYGKTALALCMAQYMAFSGVPAAYYSLEMGAEELWARLLSGASKLTSNAILTQKLDQEQMANLDKAIATFESIPLYIDESATISFDKMLRSVRLLVKQKGIKIFFVDYLQIFAQNGQGDREESVLSTMVRRLKNICKELSICCVVLSQLRRDKEEMHPRMDMLRGSGQIEESADDVILIDRPAARPEWGIMSYKGGHSGVQTFGTAEIIISKGRNIGTGSYIVGFNGSTTRFYDIDEIPMKNGTVRERKKAENKEEQANEPPEPAEPSQQELPFEQNNEKLPF